jgi:hypothetical protein
MAADKHVPPPPLAAVQIGPPTISSQHNTAQPWEDASNISKFLLVIVSLILKQLQTSAYVLDLFVTIMLLY